MPACRQSFLSAGRGVYKGEEMTSYTNPILPGFHPDPSVCRVGDTFYLVNSTFSYFPGVPIFMSRDLVHFRQIGNVLDREENLPLGTCAVNNGIYAPTIRYHEGVFYVITTNIENGGNFYVTATDPAGPWSKPHWLPEAEGIDPSLFFDDDGRAYYCGTKGAADARFFGDNVIYLRELDLERSCLFGEETIVWRGALKECEWPEGPHIYKINGWYYCMNAEGGTGPDHAVTVCRSRALRGPYEGCKANPVLTHRHMGGTAAVQCVGHADLVDDADGNWYGVCLAMRPVDGVSSLGRETFLARVSFENDWPVFNPGLGMLEASGTVSLKEYLVPGEPEKLDFTDKRLPYSVLTLRNPAPDMYSFPEEGGGICLRTLPAALTENASPAYLALRETSLDFTLETVLSFSPGEKEEAGLTLLQNNEACLRFVLRLNSGRRVLAVIRTEHGNSEVLSEIPAPESDILLRMKEERHTMHFLYGSGERGLKELPVTCDTCFLSTERAGGFVGNTLGIYASANGAESRNRAVFHYLSLT